MLLFSLSSLLTGPDKNPRCPESVLSRPVCVCVCVCGMGVSVGELYYSCDESPGCKSDTSAAPSIDQAFK